MYRAPRGGQKERRGRDPKSRGCARMEGCRSWVWGALWRLGLRGFLKRGAGRRGSGKERSQG